MGDSGEKREIAEAVDEMNAVNWMTIGEGNKETLQRTARKIRSKWAGRYDFQICKCPDKSGFELQLRHR